MFSGKHIYVKHALWAAWITVISKLEVALAIINYRIITPDLILYIPHRPSLLECWHWLGVYCFPEQLIHRQRWVEANHWTFKCQTQWPFQQWALSLSFFTIHHQTICCFWSIQSYNTIPLNLSCCSLYFGSSPFLALLFIWGDSYSSFKVQLKCHHLWEVLSECPPQARLGAPVCLRSSYWAPYWSTQNIYLCIGLPTKLWFFRAFKTLPYTSLRPSSSDRTWLNKQKLSEDLSPPKGPRGLCRAGSGWVTQGEAARGGVGGVCGSN